MDDKPMDITRLLKEWPYDEHNNIRKIQCDDGVERVQIRIDHGAFQGVMQMELDGRPDGSRPHGQTFALDYYEEKARSHDDADGTRPFDLAPDDCDELFDESRRLYERYVFLLQLSEYERVIRDTERNMALFRFVHRYGEREEDRNRLERWWPYIVRIHGVARAMLASADKRFDEALRLVAETREAIHELREVEAVEFVTERERSLQALDELASELRNSRPMSPQDRLQQELDAAVAAEEFERAARLRDRLESLETVQASSAAVDADER